VRFENAKKLQMSVHDHPVMAKSFNPNRSQTPDNILQTLHQDNEVLNKKRVSAMT